MLSFYPESTPLKSIPTVPSFEGPQNSTTALKPPALSKTRPRPQLSVTTGIPASMAGPTAGTLKTSCCYVTSKNTASILVDTSLDREKSTGGHWKTVLSPPPATNDLPYLTPFLTKQKFFSIHIYIHVTTQLRWLQGPILKLCTPTNPAPLPHPANRLLYWDRPLQVA